MQSISQSFYLRKTSTTLQVNTSQIWQHQIQISKSQLYLLFKDHYQLWDIDQNILLRKVSVNFGIFYHFIPVKITPTSIATLTLVGGKLIVYDISNLNPTFVSNEISSDQNSQQCFYDIYFFEKTGCFSAVSNNQLIYKVHTWVPSEKNQFKAIPVREFKETNKVCQYSDKEIAVIYQRSKTMALINVIDGVVEQYNLDQLSDEGSLIGDVKEYSSDKAIIGITHQNRSSTIVVFNLSQKDVIKKVEIPYKLESIMNLNWFWIATGEAQKDQISSTCLVSMLFKKQEFSVSIEIPRWNRHWAHLYPLLLLKHNQVNSLKYTMQIVKVDVVVAKRNYYIHLLDKSGLIEAFGSEVVNSALYNFEGQEL